MSQTQNLNSFAMSAIKGMIDSAFSSNVFPCYVDTGSTNTLLPGDAVKLTTTAGSVLMIDKCAAGDIAIGYVIYNYRQESFTKGMAIDIAFGGTVMIGEASGSISRGNDLEYVPNASLTIGPKMLLSAGSNPVSGMAFDNATDGQMFRFYVRGGISITPTTITGATINNTPVGQATPKAGKFTTIQSVVTALTPGTTVSIDPTLGDIFTLTPAQAETLNMASQKAGQRIVLIVTTSGTTPYVLTFNTGFAGITKYSTPGTTAAVTTFEFVSDGTSYNLVNQDDPNVVALTAGTTVSIDPTLLGIVNGVFTLTPAQNETINAASVVAGMRMALVITTSGTSSFTLTFSTNFKTTGTLATGTVSAKVFVIDFICDGTNWNEVARTTAM